MEKYKTKISEIHNKMENENCTDAEYRANFVFEVFLAIDEIYKKDLLKEQHLLESDIINLIKNN